MKTAIYGWILALGIANHALANDVANSRHATQLIRQNINLYQVDNKLFRSQQLHANDLPTIQSLGIKSMVNLRYFNRHEDEKLFANQSIHLLNRPLLTWNVQPEHIAQILWTIEQQQKNGAVLVHCYHGADRTGVVVAMYRVIYHGWTIEQAKREMRQGGFGYHSIWKNLDNLFTEDNIYLVQLELRRLREKS